MRDGVEVAGASGRLTLMFWIVAGLSILLALGLEPIALYVGGWALLGAAYGEPGTTVMGLLIIPAPLVIVTICVLAGMRLLGRGAPSALIVAGLPGILFVLLGVSVASMFSGHR